MAVNEKGLVIGSSTTIEGQILNQHHSVKKQHAAICHKDRKNFLKAIDGVTHLVSMSVYHEKNFLFDEKGGP